jgi:hypothetical protein
MNGDNSTMLVLVRAKGETTEALDYFRETESDKHVKKLEIGSLCLLFLMISCRLDSLYTVCIVGVSRKQGKLFYHKMCG